MNLQFRTLARRAVFVVTVLLNAVGLQAWAADLSLDVTLDPATRKISVIAEVEAPAPEFSFSLHPSLEVRTATSDGQRVPTTAQRVQNARTWHVQTRKNARVRLEYGGTLPELDTHMDYRRVLHS